MGAAKKILEDALELPRAERAEVAAALLASLNAAQQADADETWTAELRRRVGRVDAGESQGESWEIVEKRLVKRLSRP